MEKEARILLKQEIKICLPFYKIIYSLAFILILSLVRGISYIEEIGIAIEEPMALLAIVFCADSYLMEVQSGRFDVFKLYSLKNQTIVIWKRVLLQILYLIILAMIGYGLFYRRNLMTFGMNISRMEMVIIFIFAVAVTIMFFSFFSVVISNLFQNLWIGIGVSFAAWFFFVSKGADELLGEWNLFSYSFRFLEPPHNFDWIYGKLTAIIFVFLFIIIIPIILKKGR